MSLERRIAKLEAVLPRDEFDQVLLVQLLHVNAAAGRPPGVYRLSPWVVVVVASHRDDDGRLVLPNLPDGLSGKKMIDVGVTPDQWQEKPYEFSPDDPDLQAAIRRHDAEHGDSVFAKRLRGEIQERIKRHLEIGQSTDEPTIVPITPTERRQ